MSSTDFDPPVSQGISVSNIDMSDLDAVQNAMQPNTQLVWIESPTNPRMQAVLHLRPERRGLSSCPIPLFASCPCIYSSVSMCLFHSLEPAPLRHSTCDDSGDGCKRHRLDRSQGRSPQHGRQLYHGSVSRLTRHVPSSDPENHPQIPRVTRRSQIPIKDPKFIRRSQTPSSNRTCHLRIPNVFLSLKRLTQFPRAIYSQMHLQIPSAILRSQVPLYHSSVVAQMAPLTCSPPSRVFQRPLDLGVDICMTSATKFIAGHSDVTAGILSVIVHPTGGRVGRSQT